MAIKRWWYPVVLGLVSLGTCASAAGDPVAGKTKAIVCFGCHGEDGNGVDPRYPKLAGQLQGYIVTQTLGFKSGQRWDEAMSAMASIIPQGQDMEDIASYFSSLPVMRGTPASGDQIERGRELFKNERCVFCHEESAKPIGPFVPGAPVIGGQHHQYLLKAMKELRSGERIGDVYRLMYKTFSRLSDADLAAIAAFLSTL